MPRVMVELYRGEHSVMVEGNELKTYKKGDIFEVDVAEIKPLMDKIRLVKRKKVAPDVSPFDSESDIVLVDENEDEEVLPLDRLNVNQLTLTKLKAAGYKNINDVANASRENLIRIKGFGAKKVDTIMEDAKKAVGE
jgi:DNA-directed RNA polymerase alpha subunit